MTKSGSGDVTGNDDAAAQHVALLDALNAVGLDIVALKIQMLGAEGDELERMLEEAARLTERRAQILAELVLVEAALIESRHRALAAARDGWVRDVEALQEGGHLPPDEEMR